MKTVLATIFRTFFTRHQPAPTSLVALKAGLGGLIAIGVIAFLNVTVANPLLMAPFGATCVLLFSLPNSPLSQPANVIGGHLVSTAIGLLIHALLPVEWWSLGLSVGLAIAAMAALRITHPPAGADPLVVMLTAPGLSYLIFPVALGSISLVAIAWLFHKLPVKTIYPTPIPEASSNASN